MEFIQTILAWFAAHGAEALSAILMVLGGFSVLAKLTPTEVDDRVIQFIIDIIHKIGLTKTK